MLTITAGLKRFATEDSGAIAEEWLALIAVIVGVGLLGAHIIGQSTADVSAEVEAALRDVRLGVHTVDTSPKSP